MTLAVHIGEIQRFQFLFYQFVQSLCQRDLPLRIQSGIKPAIPKPCQHRFSVNILVLREMRSNFICILHDHKDPRGSGNHCRRIDLTDSVIDPSGYLKRNIADGQYIADLDSLLGPDQGFARSYTFMISENRIINIRIDEQDLRHPVIIDESKITRRIKCNIQSAVFKVSADRPFIVGLVIRDLRPMLLRGCFQIPIQFFSEISKTLIVSVFACKRSDLVGIPNIQTFFRTRIQRRSR